MYCGDLSKDILTVHCLFNPQLTFWTIRLLVKHNIRPKIIKGWFYLFMPLNRIIQTVRVCVHVFYVVPLVDLTQQSDIPKREVIVVSEFFAIVVAIQLYYSTISKYIKLVVIVSPGSK